MDIPRDFIRRELKEIDADHRAVLGRYRSAIARLVGNGEKLPDATRHDLLSGGLNRRRFLVVGSTSVLTSAVLGACGSSGAVKTSSSSTTSTLPGAQGDVLMLRTASSIEALAVAVYQKAIDSGLVKDPAILSATKLFQTQHVQHGDLFQRATSDAGGQPFTSPNPVLMQQVVTPRLAGLKSEGDVVNLAYDLENLAAETYQNNVGSFANKSLNVTFMQVGGIEARHVAVLAPAAAKPANPDGAYQSTKAAVAAGTGV